MVSRNYKTLQRLPALRYTPCDSFYRPFNNYITRKRILNEHYFIVAFLLMCFVDRDSFSECSRRWRLVSPRRVQASPAHVPKCSAACANCGKETFPIHSNPQSWMNRMRKRRQHPRPNAEARRNFNSTRNGNREPEMIPSSRRDSLVSLVCVFRIVREVFGCRRACRVLGGSAGSILSFRVGECSPATCWSIVINCLHDIPIVEQFVALLLQRKLRFLETLDFICHSSGNGGLCDLRQL